MVVDQLVGIAGTGEGGLVPAPEPLVGPVETRPPGCGDVVGPQGVGRLSDLIRGALT